MIGSQNDWQKDTYCDLMLQTLHNVAYICFVRSEFDSKWYLRHLVKSYGFYVMIETKPHDKSCNQFRLSF